ncbi:MAG: hypothetical protein ACRDLB_05200 [Actinomycetota bacterium]
MDTSTESGVREVLGSSVFEEDEDIGHPTFVRGSIGRGAEGFAAVLEWVGTAAGAGLLGGMSWDAFKGLIKGAKRLMRKIREKGDDRVFVSRGLAVLLAAGAVLEEYPKAALSVEAADEPSSLAGYPTPELNYVAIEPWIVTLVDFGEGLRHIVVVRPTGAIAGKLKVPLEEYEEIYLPIPRADSG